MAKILFIGETWIKHIIHQKGYDTFTSTHYEFGAEKLFEALEQHDITHIPAHAVGEMFPKSIDVLSAYDVVMVSDVGANSFLLPNEVFLEGKTVTNPLEMIKEYVRNGGSFLMIGGYMSFTGIDSKGRYGKSPLKELLPVHCLDFDDRVEKPEGINPKVSESNHEIFENMPTDWPVFLGYNETVAKDSSQVLATIGEHPFIAYQVFGSGKSMVFTSDCAPHWGSHEFMSWTGFRMFWNNLVDFLEKK